MAQSSWSSWLGVGSESRAAAKERKLQEKAAAEAAAVAALRERLSSEEGRICAQQLASTGEFGRGGKVEDADDEAFLRRWLRARDFDVEVAYALLLRHGAWRARVLARGYIPEEEVAKPLAANTIFLQGVDRDGRALIIVKVANHHAKDRDVRQMRLFSTFIMEAMVSLCDRSRNPTCRLSSMFDLTGCSLSNMDAAVMKDILALLSVHYVERLSVMYFYNPPTIFWGLWEASKPLLPPVTREKIKLVFPSDVAQLHAWLEEDVLPAEYGGKGALVPLADAVRRFKLPPHDGRLEPGGGGAADAPDAELVLGDGSARGGKAADDAAAAAAASPVAAAVEA